MMSRYPAEVDLQPSSPLLTTNINISAFRTIPSLFIPMSSRKRTHPDDDSNPSAPPAPPPPPVLAPRSMFFSIPLRTVAVQDQPQQAALPALSGPHLQAHTRLTDVVTVLNGLQRASLTAVLSVLNTDFPADATTRTFTHLIADTTESDDAVLAALADRIDLGLIAFLTKRAGHSSTPDDAPDDTTTSSSSTTIAVPPKRARVSKKSGRSTRSQKIRVACKKRDNEQCRLCNGPLGVSAHILPFSLQGRKALDFWAFVGMFRGVAATEQLKAASLDPEPTNPDNIMNVIFLCLNCHGLLDKPLVSLIPQILESSDSVFPYDPRAVEEYNAVVEFPAGMKMAIVSVVQPDGEVKRMRAGHVVTLRTADPAALPLPHPLLLQLHAICSRMVVMRAAAGYPVLEDDSDADTVCDALWVGEDEGGGLEAYGEFGGKDEPRDPAVVLLEMDQRRSEQERLLRKLRGGELGVVARVEV